MKTTREKKQLEPQIKKTGRPWFDGKDVKSIMAKLEEAASIDASVEESLFYADISRDSYYRFLEANPDFRNRLLALREKPVMLARQTVVTKLKENYSNAMDYLSRKRKSEFSQRNEVTGKDGESIVIQISKEIAEKNAINTSTS